MAKSRAYNAENIEVPTDVENVRNHPGMYVGELDELGAWITTREVLSNATDEAVSGFADTVYIERLNKYRFIVYDNGRGIPVDNHPTEKVPAIQLVFCKLHAGGKLRQETTTYKKSFGTHGVGACVANALSASLSAYTYRKGWHLLECVNGSPKKVVKATPPKLRYPQYFNKKKGTLIDFTLDASMFTGEIADDIIIDYLAVISDFYPRITFIYADEVGEEVFYNTKSVQQLVAERNGVAAKDVLHVSHPRIEAAICFSRKEPLKSKMYVCGAPTPDGGTHWQGLVKAVEIAVAPHVKKEVFGVEALAMSLSGVLNVELLTPKFNGQTKQRLLSKEAVNLVRDALKEPLAQFFNKHKPQLAEAIKRAEALHAMEQRHKAEKDLDKSLTSKKGKLNLPARLVIAPHCDPKKRELYITEGDSATGPAKNARDHRTQEIMPLTGKILNVVKNDGKVVNNVVVQDLLRVIGYRSDDKKMERARVQGKIIFLTDADSDGGHIQLLLISLMHKYLPHALKSGMVHIVDMPLFSYKGPDEQAFGNTIAEIKSQVKKFSPSYLSRAKGWGACSDAHLAKLAFDPKTRKLIKLSPILDHDLPEFYGLLTGDTTLRRKMLTYKKPTAKQSLRQRIMKKIRMATPKVVNTMKKFAKAT
jgi:DNA gyrase subunit B